MMRLHLKQQQTLATSPYTYSKQEDHLIATNTNKLRVEKLKLTVYILFGIGMWAQLLLADKEKTETVIWLQSLYYAGAYSAILLSKLSIVKSSPEIVELYNMFVNYERDCLNGKFWLLLNSQI